MCAQHTIFTKVKQQTFFCNIFSSLVFLLLSHHIVGPGMMKTTLCSCFTLFWLLSSYFSSCSTNIQIQISYFSRFIFLFLIRETERERGEKKCFSDVLLFTIARNESFYTRTFIHFFLRSFVCLCVDGECNFWEFNVVQQRKLHHKCSLQILNAEQREAQRKRKKNRIHMAAKHIQHLSSKHSCDGITCLADAGNCLCCMWILCCAACFHYFIFIYFYYYCASDIYHNIITPEIWGSAISHPNSMSLFLSVVRSHSDFFSFITFLPFSL